MASIGEDFRRFLIEYPSLHAIVGDRVHQDMVPQVEVEPDGYFDPYIWFASSGVGREECTNQPVGEDPDWWEIDLECVAFDGLVAEEIARLIRDLDGYSGSVGGRQTQGIFVDDQTDDYVPRTLRPDFGASVRAVAIEFHRRG